MLFRSKHTMEMRAILEYAKVKKVRQVPVDDYKLLQDFVPHMRALEEFVKSRSSAYCNAIDEMSRKQFELGLRYLNSSEFISCIKLSERLFQETVHMYGNDLAKAKLAEWKDQICGRDASMLKNIRGFCEQTEFKEGVFLVGAGHMPSIMNSIEQSMKDQNPVVNWRFWNWS